MPKKTGTVRDWLLHEFKDWKLDQLQIYGQTEEQKEDEEREEGGKKEARHHHQQDGDRGLSAGATQLGNDLMPFVHAVSRLLEVEVDRLDMHAGTEGWLIAHDNIAPPFSKWRKF